MTLRLRRQDARQRVQRGLGNPVGRRFAFHLAQLAHPTGDIDDTAMSVAASSAAPIPEPGAMGHTGWFASVAVKVSRLALNTLALPESSEPWHIEKNPGIIDQYVHSAASAVYECAQFGDAVFRRDVQRLEQARPVPRPTTFSRAISPLPALRLVMHARGSRAGPVVGPFPVPVRGWRPSPRPPVCHFCQST
jgi:hypothetical protein